MSKPIDADLRKLLYLVTFRISSDDCQFSSSKKQRINESGLKKKNNKNHRVLAQRRCERKRIIRIIDNPSTKFVCSVVRAQFNSSVRNSTRCSKKEIYESNPTDKKMKRELRVHHTHIHIKKKKTKTALPSGVVKSTRVIHEKSFLPLLLHEKLVRISCLLMRYKSRYETTTVRASFRKATRAHHRGVDYRRQISGEIHRRDDRRERPNILVCKK